MIDRTRWGRWAEKRAQMFPGQGGPSSNFTKTDISGIKNVKPISAASAVAGAVSAPIAHRLTYGTWTSPDHPSILGQMALGASTGWDEGDRLTHTAWNGILSPFNKVWLVPDSVMDEGQRKTNELMVASARRNGIAVPHNMETDQKGRIMPTGRPEYANFEDMYLSGQNLADTSAAVGLGGAAVGKILSLPSEVAQAFGVSPKVMSAIDTGGKVVTYGGLPAAGAVKTYDDAKRQIDYQSRKDYAAMVEHAARIAQERGTNDPEYNTYYEALRLGQENDPKAFGSLPAPEAVSHSAAPAASSPNAAPTANKVNPPSWRRWYDDMGAGGKAMVGGVGGAGIGALLGAILGGKGGWWKMALLGALLGGLHGGGALDGLWNSAGGGKK